MTEGTEGHEGQVEGSVPDTMPQIDPAIAAVAIEQLKGDQNLVAGAVAGALAALAGAGVWAAITVMTGYQIGWMAVGVGFLVGFANRIAGNGIDSIFGVVGAVLALLGCLLGNFLSMVYFIGQSESMGFFEVLSRVDLTAVLQLMMATFSPMDLLFYGLAIYEGYKLSFRQITMEDLGPAVVGQSG